MSRWEHKRWTLNAGDVRQVDQWMNFRSGWQQAGQRQQNKRLNKDWSANWTLIQTKLMRGWRAVGRPEKQRWGVEGKTGLGGAQVSRRKGGKTDKDKVVHMKRNNWTKNPNMTCKCETTGYVWRGTTAFKLLETWHHALDTFKETSGTFPATFLVTKPNVFNKTFKIPSAIYAATGKNWYFKPNHDLFRTLTK